MLQVLTCGVLRKVRLCLPPMSSYYVFNKAYCSGKSGSEGGSAGNIDKTPDVEEVAQPPVHHSITAAAIGKSFQDDFKNANDTDAPIPKSVKLLLAVVGVSATLCGMYLILEYGKPETLDPNESVWKQYLDNMRRQILTLAMFIQEPSREKLLPDPVSYPYYQPPYTLVLEFTDVLAHPDWTYKTGWRFKKRPALDYMLENLVGLYEIVVFTAEPGMTIFPVIEALDKKNLISYKLVRDSTHFVDGHHVKNLDRLNRDLRKVIVVDWNTESVKFHPENQLNLPRWKGEDEDTTLVDLTSFLKTIALTEIEDVREVLKFYKQFSDPLAEFRNKQREFFEKPETTAQQQYDKPTQSIKKYFNYLV